MRSEVDISVTEAHLDCQEKCTWDARVQETARLGADAWHLHDMMEAVQVGWQPGTDKVDPELLGDELTSYLDSLREDRGGERTQTASKKLPKVLGVLWPDIVAECEREASW